MSELLRSRTLQLLVVCSGIVCTPSRARCDERAVSTAPDFLTHRQKAAARRAAIHTVHASGRYINGFVNLDPSLSAASTDVLSELEAAFQIADVDGVDSLAASEERIVGLFSRWSIRGDWHKFEILDDGTASRATLRAIGGDVGPDAIVDRVKFVDGEHDFSPRMKQLVITPRRDNYHMLQFKDICHLLNPDSVTPDVFVSWERLSFDRALLKLRRSESIVNTELWMEERIYSGGRNQPSLAVFQSRALAATEPAPVPRQSFKAHFQRFGGTFRLRRVQYTIVEDVEFNQGVAEQEFEINVPAGTVVVQVDEQGKPLISRRILDDAQTVDKALAEVKSAAAENPARPPRGKLEPSSSSWHWLILLLNCGALVVLVGIVVLRKRRGEE